LKTGRNKLFPENADIIEFKEFISSELIESNKGVYFTISLIGITIYIKILLVTNNNFSFFSIYGFLLSFLVIIPHEFLHAIAFPKNAEVQVWYSFKNMTAFVYSTHQISKLRFIYICLLPSIIFGVIPLVVWIFIPVEFFVISKTVFTFAIGNLFFELEIF